MATVSLQGYLGIGEETTWGTKVSPDVYIPINSESISTDTGGLFPDDIRGDRSRHQVQEGPVDVSGDFDWNPAPEDGIGEILKGALGSVSSTLATTGVYEHTFESSATLPSYTIEINVGDTMRRKVPGGKIDELTLSCADGEMLSATASMIGKGEEIDETVRTPSYGTETPFAWSQGQVTIDGTVEANVESIEIVNTNSLIDDFYAIDETRERAGLPEGRREITGSLDISFEDVDYYKWFLGGGTAPQSTPRFASLTLEFTGPVFAEGSAYYLNVSLPKMRLDTSDVAISDADRVVQSIDFDALEDPSSGDDITAKLVNSKSSY